MRPQDLRAPAPETTAGPDLYIKRPTSTLTALTGHSGDSAPGQFEAVSALVEQRRRVLVVQKTGWGKSAVYFLAANLLRRRGRGVSLIVSPLIALMRDQIAAAERAGVRAEAVNSANAHAMGLRLGRPAG